MADFVFNIAKGRVAELYNRVDTNDPANSAIIAIPVDVGAVTDATLRDVDTFAALIAAGVTERNANGWNRKTLTDTELAAYAPDDTNDRADVDVPDLVWSPGPTSGAVTDIVFCYDSDTTAGTDANLIPLTQHDFPITPDGSDVTAQIAATGFFRAT
jgi:hypothetical protein